MKSVLERLESQGDLEVSTEGSSHLHLASLNVRPSSSPSGCSSVFIPHYICSVHWAESHGVAQGVPNAFTARASRSR